MPATPTTNWNPLLDIGDCGNEGTRGAFLGGVRNQVFCSIGARSGGASFVWWCSQRPGWAARRWFSTAGDLRSRISRPRARCGHVGNGVTAARLTELQAQLDARAPRTYPAESAGNTTEARKNLSANSCGRWRARVAVGFQDSGGEFAPWPTCVQTHASIGGNPINRVGMQLARSRSFTLLGPSFRLHKTVGLRKERFGTIVGNRQSVNH